MADNITVDGYTIAATDNGAGILTPKHLEDATQRTALLAAINALATAAGQTTLIGHVDGVEATLTSLLAKVIAAPATEAKQDTLNGHVDGIEATLTSILAKIIAAPATETSVAAILAKIIAAPATEAKQDTTKTAVDLINTNLGSVTGSPTANTVLARLKDIVTAITTMPAANVLANGIDAATTGASTGALPGGTYAASATCNTWNGASVAIQSLGDNGSTWITFATFTANGATGGFTVGQDSEVRCVVTGTPTDLYVKFGMTGR